MKDFTRTYKPTERNPLIGKPIYFTYGDSHKIVGRITKVDEGYDCALLTAKIDDDKVRDLLMSKSAGALEVEVKL